MFEEVRDLFGQALQLGDRTAGLQPESRLLGELPELDSMAIVTVMTTLEESYGFEIDDDEISADTFETMGTLVTFVEQKTSQ